MSRELFLTVIGSLGLVVGFIAALLPGVLLSAKGVEPSGTVQIWMRETGALIFALSAVVLLVRREPDSASLHAVLWGNALAHAALLPVEVWAWRSGLISRLSGIVPNSVLHVVAAAGFAFFALN
jgi:hypothetical protein